MMCFVLQVGTQKADKHLTCKLCVQAAEIQFKEYKGYKSDVHPCTPISKRPPPILGKRIQNLHRN